MAVVKSRPKRMRAYKIGDQSSDLTLRMVERPEGVVCLTCRSEDIRHYVRGSIYIELILWVGALIPVFAWGYSGGLLIFVALIYSIWRRSGLNKYRCGDCYSTDVIPIDSPVGMALGANAEEIAES